MPTNPLTPQEMRDAVLAVARVCMEPGFTYPKQPGAKSAMEEAAKRLGMNPRTLTWRVQKAHNKAALTIEAAISDIRRASLEEIETIPDGAEVLDRMAGQNATRIQKVRASMLRLIPVRAEPFAVAFFGDPHMDNKHCNLAQLRTDVLTAKAAGFRAIQMGDVLDNFHATGKLAAIQADNSVSVAEGLGLARWLIRDCGVKWDGHILGNHDAWLKSPGFELMNGWAREAGTRFYDWSHNFEYRWDGGSFKVTASHDFKGHSIYNPLHGNMKRALEDGWADLYVAGHRHNAAIGGAENAFRGRHYKFLRVKGYKDADSYAHRGGYQQQREGHSGVVVVDPTSETMEGRQRLCYDFSEAAEVLAMLKRRAAA
jgi:hypothetical protein